MEDKTGGCGICTASCAGDFKKVVDLQSSGLVTYLYSKNDGQIQSSASKSDDIYILHNTGGTEIKKPDYVRELHQYQKKCAECKTTIQRVRSLLEEIRAIRQDEIIGVCEHCKRTSLNKTCNRCDFIVSKFVSLNEKIRKKKQERFKAWVCKVKHLLQAMLDQRGVGQHRGYKDIELERILNELKAPLATREPYIDFFPGLDPEQLTSLKRLSENKEMLEELLSKIKSQSEKRFSSDEYGETIFGLDTGKYQLTKDTDLSGGSKDFGALLSQKEYEDLINRLLALSKALPRGLSFNKELILHIIKTLNTSINQGLSTDIIETLIKELEELNKTLPPDLSADLNKESIQKLINDLSLLTLGSNKDLNKTLLQLLIDLSASLTLEMSKGLTKEHTQMLSKNDQKYIMKAFPKGLDTKGKISSLTSQSTETGPLTSKSSPKDIKMTEKQGLPKGVDKSVKQGLPKDVNKSVKQGLPKKDMTRELPKEKKEKGKSLASLTDLNKANKDSKLGSSIIRSKEKTRASFKDIQIVKKMANLHKALTGGLQNKSEIRELAEAIQKDFAQRPTDLMKKIVNELADLCKLAVQDLSKDINMKLLQGLINDANKTISDGLSKEPNKKKLQGVLHDINKKKSLIVISAKDSHKGQQLSKGLKKGISKEVSKDLSSGLTSKAFLAPGSSRKGVKKSTSKSEENIYKKQTKFEKSLSKKEFLMDKMSKESETKLHSKPDTSPSKKKYLMEKTSKDAETKLQSKGKENLTPKDEKKEKSLLQMKQAQPPESVLLSMLRDSQVNKDKYELFKQKQLAKQKELEKKRLRELLQKNKAMKKKKKIPLPPPVLDKKSFIECDIKKSEGDKLMIKGDTITSYDPHYKDVVTNSDDELKPLMFKKSMKFSEDAIFAADTLYKGNDDDYENMFRDGIIRYKLSEKEFIDKGWTVLPTQKIMRRMNIYKMEPANPQYDWFARHKEDKVLFYDTGHKLADIDENGRGHWYYHNGALALEYYNAQDLSIGQRYIVYSSGEEIENSRLKTRTVLALFDVRGNGVIYDICGNVRLKYNQSEGLLVDPKLGAPGRWKWHALNDPPVLQQVFINTQSKVRDHKLLRVQKPEKTQDATDFEKAEHPEMLSIELDNFVKEKATKILQKYEPFKIKMKAVKLNEQFSLKILDQANIYLIFRERTTSLKLNLGMLLISNEIIDIDTSDMTDVATPYDKYPPKSPSVENIQNILKSGRIGKLTGNSVGRLYNSK